MLFRTAFSRVAHFFQLKGVRSLAYGRCNVHAQRDFCPRLLSGGLRFHSVVGASQPAISFETLGIAPEVLQDAGSVLAEFKKPTDIQVASIPPILARKNIVVGSETGSGKTLAYTLPVLSMLQAEDREHGRCRPHRPRAVVLMPNRELAAQVCA